MSSGTERLEAALGKLAERGLEKLEAEGELELKALVEHARAFVHSSTSDAELRRELEAGLDILAAGAPVFAGAAADELRDLFASGFLAADAGYREGLAELAFQERRSAMRARTRAAAERARARAERLAFLGDLLGDLGAVALKLLPLLVAAL